MNEASEIYLWRIMILLPVCTLAVVAALLAAVVQLSKIRRAVERPPVEHDEHEYGIQHRRGFTLIELLVTLGIMLVLATLAILFFPGAASSARESRAAIAFQGYLNIAKQRAMRDQKPYGVRLWWRPTDRDFLINAEPWTPGKTYRPLDAVLFGVPTELWRNVDTLPNGRISTAPNSPTGATSVWTRARLVTDCQYIEQPDDYSTSSQPNVTGAVRKSSIASNVPPGAPAAYTPLNTLEIFFPRMDPSFPAKQPIDLTNGNAPVQIPNIDARAKFWHVQPGDYIELNGGGLVRQITQVGVPIGAATTSTDTSFIVVTPALPYQIPLVTSAPPISVTGSTQFKIIRAPRVVGDETLTLPSGAFLDLDTNGVYFNQLPQPNAITQGGGFFDILFAPSGQVITKGINSKATHLWVRCAHQEFPADPNRGDPTIVSAFTKTGLVGAYAIDPNTLAITAFVNDAANPGKILVTTQSAHGYAVGDSLVFAGMPAPFSGPQTVESLVPLNPNQFRILSSVPAAGYPGGGVSQAPYRLAK